MQRTTVRLMVCVTGTIWQMVAPQGLQHEGGTCTIVGVQTVTWQGTDSVTCCIVHTVRCCWTCCICGTMTVTCCDTFWYVGTHS